MSFTPGGGGGSSSIGGSSDVALSNPANLETLRYDSGLSKWKNTVAYLYATFNEPGTLTVMAGAGRFHFPADATIIGCSASVGTAPTGDAVIVDILKNGSSIYITASRPTIETDTNSSTETIPDEVEITAGQYLTVDIVQVGSTIAGTDLTVQVRYQTH